MIMIVTLRIFLCLSVSVLWFPGEHFYLLINEGPEHGVNGCTNSYNEFQKVPESRRAFGPGPQIMNHSNGPGPLRTQLRVEADAEDFQSWKDKDKDAKV